MGELLNSIGIHVNWSGLPSTPRYLQLRDELDAMCWLRRWLSFKMRREFEQVRFQNMQETLDETMRAGDEMVGQEEDTAYMLGYPIREVDFGADVSGIELGTWEQVGDVTVGDD